ncbi:hypothetical protein GCM10027062_15280 [Nocardioides hungaricus]
MMKPPREWPPEDPRRAPVTLRREYLAIGYNDRALARLVADGVLAKPRRGAYVAGSAWRQLDEVGRHAVRSRAVLAQAGTEVALSHTSGLVEYDAPTWRLPLDDVEVTRLDGRAGRREAGVRQHRGVLLDGDVVERNGVPVVAPTRLALETTMLTDAEVALGVVNHLLHHGLTTLPTLEARYAGMVTWPRSLTTDLVLRLADQRIESLGESRCLYLFFRHHLPLPELQYEVKDASGRVVGRVDFAWPELGVFVEFDGKVKYEKLLKPGQRASDVVVAEKKREELICRITGWRCIRLTWADLERAERTAAMLRTYLRRRTA